VQPSDGAYYVAYAEHAAQEPKIRSFVCWLQQQASEKRQRDALLAHHEKSD
jgi:hypothetical protein